MTTIDRLEVHEIKRALRIELRSTAWKAMVLPLNYARALSGINFPLHYHNISKEICKGYRVGAMWETIATTHIPMLLFFCCASFNQFNLGCQTEKLQHLNRNPSDV